jgi:spore coat-associated protein N
MMNPKKLAIFSVTGVLAAALAIGGSTYALFSSKATNANNTFTSGKVSVSSARDDIPMEGPMFYTESPSDVTGIGGLATGVWAPGDINTRGLFISNTGTLDAKLANLKATPVKYTGSGFTPASSGDPQYETDMLFANNATVTVWEVAKYDPTGDKIKHFDNDLSARDINIIMTSLNAAYEVYENLFPNTPQSLTEAARILDGDYLTGYHFAYGNAQMLQAVNDLVKKNKNGSNSEDFVVTKVVKAPLKDLVNGKSGSSISLPTGGTSLLAYSVSLNKAAGNDLQDITPYFNFSSDWVQVRNN